jgi:flagellar hook-length control protein FliK
MDIQSLALATNPTPLSVKVAKLNLSQLFIGQILNATVVSKKSPESFMLQIGNQQVEAKTDPNRPLNIGEQLKLSVAKQDNPVTLKVLEQNTPKLAHESKQQLLRESMPKQAGMDKLSSVLAQVSKNIKEAIKTLPAPVEQQFKKLIEQLPVKNNVNNEAGLKSTIKNSGLFFEAKLLAEASNKSESFLKMINMPSKEVIPQGSKPVKSQTHQLIQQLSQHTDIAKDLKTNLLQLSDVINKYKQSVKAQENIPGNLKETFQQNAFVKQNIATDSNSAKAQNNNKVIELALKSELEMLSKQIESSVARIEVNQSKAVVTHDNQQPLWTIETPVKDKHDIDLLELNIHADKDSKKENEQQQWSTDIKITFENIGTISAKLSVMDKEVNATLWSENEVLNGLINKNLSSLNKQIEKCGLSTGNIVCMREAPTIKELPQASNNLINITI